MKKLFKKFWPFWIAIFLSLILFILKLSHIVTWDWCMITAPLWALATIILVIAFFSAAITPAETSDDY